MGWLYILFVTFLIGCSNENLLVRLESLEKEWAKKSEDLEMEKVELESSLRVEMAELKAEFTEKIDDLEAQVMTLVSARQMEGRNKQPDT